MVPSLYGLMAMAGNALKVMRLGGNGAWPKGSATALVEALGSEACVVEELDRRQLQQRVG